MTRIKIGIRNPEAKCKQCGKNIGRTDINTCPATKVDGKRVPSKCEHKFLLAKSRVAYQLRKHRNNPLPFIRNTPEADSLEYVKKFEVKPQMRYCLKCDPPKKFLSHSKGNRTCPTHASENAKVFSKTKNSRYNTAYMARCYREG